MDKTCSICKIPSPIENYHRDRTKLDGRDARCKPCNNRRISGTVHSPATVERKKIYFQAWREQNRESRNAHERARRSQPNGRDTHRAANQRRRAVKRGVATEKFLDVEIFKRDGYVCQICLGSIDNLLKYPDQMSVSLDHKIPLSKGGHHSMDNVQAAHLRCNILKSNRLA